MNMDEVGNQSNDTISQSLQSNQSNGASLSHINQRGRSGLDETRMNSNQNTERQFVLAGWPIRNLLLWMRNYITPLFRFATPLLNAVSFAVTLLLGRGEGNLRSIDDSVEFSDSFERQYGSCHPVFCRGSYEQAVNSAKENLQFLLVYLHCSKHEDTDRFCREVLCNQEFVDRMNEIRILVWGIDVETYEGHREASEALRPATFPFLAVISPRENKMVVVNRMEGKLTLDEVISSLIQTFEDNEPYLVVARDERNERRTNQLLREQQDAAYQESLRVDQEKERRKKEEIDRIEKEKEEEDRRLKEAQERLDRHNSDRSMRANRIPVEPSSDDPTAVRIIIKFPSGTRLERRFSIKDTLETLYDYVYTSDEVPVDFVIVTNFPRKILTYDKLSPQIPTLEDLGVVRPTMLFIQDETED